MTLQTELPADCEIELSRVLDAPRELVWKAWTEQEHLAQWWGPQGFTTTTHKRELKAGGCWRFVMHGPDGRDYENKITYLEVVAPERLSYKHGGEVDLEPVNFQVTVTFEEVAPNKTKLTMKSIFPSKKARDFVIREYNAVEGGKQTLGRLAEHLQRMEQASASAHKPFAITRVFPVPVEKIWSVWTNREHLMNWFGPTGMSIPHATLDLRPGGIFHYCMRGPDGNDMWAKWTFRDISAPHRLEFVLSFTDEHGNTIRPPFEESWPHEMHTVVTFDHHAGIGRGTVVKIESSALNPSAEQQKVFTANHDSMRQGWGGTLDQLGEFLAK